MPSHSRSTATELLVRAARITIARWKAVSIALAGLGSIFSVSVLFTYLHVIGYPKLLGAAMTTKGALIPWIFITGLSFALYLAGLLVTSASYASALSFFKHNPQDQTAMSLLLMIPALTGIIALASSIIMMQRIGPIGAMAVAGGAVVATMLLMFLIPYFREKVCSNAVTDCEVHERSRLKQTLQIGVLTIAVWGTALTTVLPMLVLFSVYAWPANQHGILKLIATSVAITGVALFPAAAFFIGSDGVLTRARNALLARYAYSGGNCAVSRTICRAYDRLSSR
ncbi:hypothetical protein [Pseudomonas gingeri]|uniref:Uncharacterized protein n=1 Tax=Pseudomonas gingeri TaxID=117681 RepID=A0A7Y8BL70_9PSED|nr:hypothetical protein [Pseudomonas gingeri]NWB47921.1 hypothetical protein [Pseudomonas gingeri]